MFRRKWYHRRDGVFDTLVGIVICVHVAVAIAIMIFGAASVLYHLPQFLSDSYRNGDWFAIILVSACIVPYAYILSGWVIRKVTRKP